MAKPTAQQCHAMTSYFVKRYGEVLGRDPIVNRNKARYGFEGILMDFSPDGAKKIIDYYLEHYESPTIEWFLYNYEKVVASKEESAEEERARQARREATQKRLEEWRNRWKKS